MVGLTTCFAIFRLSRRAPPDDPHSANEGDGVPDACPQVAVAPTSGAGAGKHGGRANRIGLNALYLALDVNTAVREYQQISPLMPPGTLVSYQLTVDPIVDFTSGYHAEKWLPIWEDFYCDWRGCWFN